MERCGGRGRILVCAVATARLQAEKPLETKLPAVSWTLETAAAVGAADRMRKSARCKRARTSSQLRHRARILHCAGPAQV